MWKEPPTADDLASNAVTHLNLIQHESGIEFDVSSAQIAPCLVEEGDSFHGHFVVPMSASETIEKIVRPLLIARELGPRNARRNAIRALSRFRVL